MPSKFKVGDNNPFVADIQQALNEKMGANGPQFMPFQAYLKRDGGFGPKTRDTLMVFQKTNGLPASGEYDSGTAQILDPYIELRFLTESDYVKAAASLQCDVAMIKAVTEVESKDFGFFENGQPEILFERHVFRQRLLALMKASTAVAMNVAKLLGIGVPVTGPNISLIDETMIKINGDIYNDQPRGYLGGAAEYKRMDKAAQFSKEAAQTSASWGLFQIMGYHFAALGYPNSDDFVTRMKKSEDEQLDAFVKFVKINPKIWTAVREKNPLQFAVNYNGPAQQGYDQRIAVALKKFGG